jgi:arylsulfatase A-like enzyme
MLPSGGLFASPVYFKPEIYAGSRADSDTFLEVLTEVPRRHPRLLVVHLVDADEEAHLQQRVQRRTALSYGVFHYHQALRATDYYIGRIWAMLQADPFYRDNTYLMVSTDHGRDDFPEPGQWAMHGHCVSEFGARKTCSGCSSIFAVAIGPGLPARSVKRGYDHTSLAPTIARLLGFAMPSATGPAMEELFVPVKSE